MRSLGACDVGTGYPGPLAAYHEDRLMSLALGILVGAPIVGTPCTGEAGVFLGGIAGGLSIATRFPGPSPEHLNAGASIFLIADPGTRTLEVIRRDRSLFACEQKTPSTALKCSRAFLARSPIFARSMEATPSRFRGCSTAERPAPTARNAAISRGSTSSRIVSDFESPHACLRHLRASRLCPPGAPHRPGSDTHEPAASGLHV